MFAGGATGGWNEAAPAAGGPSGAQIASIAVTANQVDIDAGKLAESKGSTKEVKAFGKQMVTDHSGVNQQAVALVTKLKVTPEDNPTSQSLKAGGAETSSSSKACRAPRSTRLTSTTKWPTTNRCSMPSTRRWFPMQRTKSSRRSIVKVRPAFVAHLEHAKMIQASLKK